MANEFTQALTLQPNSECSARIMTRDDDATLYREDAYDTIELRFADRQWLINNYSPQQLDEMKARVEQAITALFIGQVL